MSYRRIVTAAGTTFVAVLIGGWTLWLHCELVEFGLTGFHRTACDVTGVGLLLAVFAPLGTTVAGLLSREYDRSASPFYALWVGSVVLGAALLITALVFEN